MASQSTVYRPVVFRAWYQTNSISITWELVRTANSQAYESELLGAEPSARPLTSPPGDSDAQEFEDHKLCCGAADFDGDVKTALCSRRANEETVGLKNLR